MLRRVLIVDDNAINRAFLRKTLSSDYEILEAESGETALQLLSKAQGSVSAVLLDISMPGINGYEVLRRIRDDSSISRIPVIMVTASDDNESRVKSLSEGANDFVTKPYTPDVIKHCLETNIALNESVATIQLMKRDKLTGLYNREPFFQRVREMVDAHESGFYIMTCFDVDSFKVINDQYGMQKGDDVLRHIAEVFKKGFHPNGGLCCRMSADTFAVIYPATFQGTAEIEEIRRKSTRVEGLVVPIIFSIGRYTIDDLSLAASTMYDRANIAMVSVKGRYDKKIAQYDESMRLYLLHNQKIVQEMEAALETRQFEVWFQPQYNHSTDAMIGSEALVRWRHPRNGLIPPGKFIPIFEQNGFIYELDKFVWEEVCRYQRKWIDENRKPLPVSVNISRYDVLRPDLIDVIIGLVKKYRIPAELLRVEVTESAFSNSSQIIIDVVKALIEYGFTVEIDDFGSGYSSLNTLKDVPAQILKLDMKFLERSSDSQRGGNIVESVIRMAKWLGMSVIAEGVETKSQADFLRSVGCSYMQGYLFAKPMPVNEYEELCSGLKKEERLLTLETVENLNNNSFWDPDSMDTLIFNSYVGGACIFEYHNGVVELLRATEKYAEVIGRVGMTVEEALKLDWKKHLDSTCRKRLASDLEKSATDKNEVSGEFIFIDLPDCPHKTYLRSSIRVIASAGDRYLVYCTNENITAQREAEKREHDVAEKMSLIMANVSSGICATVRKPNGDYRIIFANDRFYSMYGYTKEQMDIEHDGSVLRVIHPDDLDRVLNIVKGLESEQDSATYEYRCIKRDGTEITARCSNTIAAFPGIDEMVLLAVINDITEQVESEREIRKLSEQLQAIMDNVDLGIIAAVVEEDSAKYVFANDRYYSMLGYTKEQFENEVSSPYQTVASEDIARVKAQTALVNETGESITLEYNAVLRNNTRRYFRSAISIGRLAGIASPVQLSIVRDVTEEKNAELREKRANEQINAILKDIDSGLTATVLKNGKVELLFSNEQFYRTRGYTKEQYRREIGEYYESVHRDDRERLRSASREVYLSGKPLRDEYRIIMRDGTERIIRINMTATRFTGIEQPVVLSVYTDITAEKEAELATEKAMAQLCGMMDDMPGGFCRICLMPDNSLKPVYINNGLCNLLGRSRNEINEFFLNNIMAGVHPDDIDKISIAVERIIKNGKGRSECYRLQHKSGKYIWVSIFGRLTTDISGDRFLNIYYIDGDDQIKNEELQKALLDNLPGGAGIYELINGEISLVYQNKGFWNLVGLDREVYPDPSPMSAVHQDDINILMHEILTAISFGHDLSCDIRLRHLRLGYRKVHLAGRIIPKNDNRFIIYATFTPLSASGTS